MNRFDKWSVPLLEKYRIACLRVTLRELENFLYISFFMTLLAGQHISQSSL